MLQTIYSMLLLAFVSCSFAEPNADAVSACKRLSFDDKLHMMSGYGEIDGYSRNSGCAGLCHRKTFRWDNGPQVSSTPLCAAKTAAELI